MEPTPLVPSWFVADDGVRPEDILAYLVGQGLAVDAVTVRDDGIVVDGAADPAAVLAALEAMPADDRLAPAVRAGKQAFNRAKEIRDQVEAIPPASRTPTQTALHALAEGQILLLRHAWSQIEDVP
jgi:hypothetical protein